MSTTNLPALRVGEGWDTHALVVGRPLVLGGVTIAHSHGLLGHSDADALLHAITDAVLGGAGLGDIGRHFPDTALEFKGADSHRLLTEAMRRVRAAGWQVVNVDCTIVAQAMDRTGFAAGTLAVREGLSAEVPPLDPRPVLTMADMGHDMSAAGHDMSTMAGHDMPTMEGHDMSQIEGHDMSSMSGHDMSQMADAQHDATSHAVTHPPTEVGNPLVDMQAMAPTSKLDDPGIGLRANGRRVLTYAQLRSAFPDPDGRIPGRTIELHLTGHMERFAWSIDGVPFSHADPIRLTYGERVRIVIVNDTMMSHPIHLHGLWSDLEDDAGQFLVRKHTLDLPPGSRRVYRVTANALGRWAYHCHLLFHMESGMMREVRVEDAS